MKSSNLPLKTHALHRINFPTMNETLIKPCPACQILATNPTTTPSPMAQSPSLATKRGRRPRQKQKTMAEEVELYHQRIYQLYRQAIDF